MSIIIIVVIILMASVYDYIHFSVTNDKVTLKKFPQPLVSVVFI